MENKKLKNFVLTKSDFEYLNDEDCFMIFSEERDKIFDAFPTEDQCNFHHHIFDKNQTVLLFNKFNNVVIDEENNLWGETLKNRELIKITDGFFEAASDYYKKKGLH